jgi:hypothetical protein
MLRMRGRRDRLNWDPRARPPPPTSIDGWLESLEGRERRALVTATTYGQPTADARAHVKRPRPAGGRAGAGGDTPTRAHQWTTTCRGHGLLPLPAGHTTAAAMHFPWTTHASFVQTRRSGTVLVRCSHAGMHAAGARRVSKPLPACSVSAAGFPLSSRPAAASPAACLIRVPAGRGDLGVAPCGSLTWYGSDGTEHWHRSTRSASFTLFFLKEHSQLIQQFVGRADV